MQESVPDQNVDVQQPPEKKKGLPLWVVLLVLILCGVTVYAVYSQLLKEKPPIRLPSKNAAGD